MISSDGGVSFFDSKPSPRFRHVDADLIRDFEGSTKPGEVADFCENRQNSTRRKISASTPWPWMSFQPRPPDGPRRRPTPVTSSPAAKP